MAVHFLLVAVFVMVVRQEREWSGHLALLGVLVGAASLANLLFDSSAMRRERLHAEADMRMACAGVSLEGISRASQACQRRLGANYDHSYIGM